MSDAEAATSPVIVTGGASGLGAAVVDALDKAGARAVVLDRAAPDRDVETELVDHAADDEVVLEEARHRARDRAGCELGRQGSVGLAHDHRHRSPVDGISRLENRHRDRNRQRRDQDDEPRLAFQGLQVLPQW